MSSLTPDEQDMVRLVADFVDERVRPRVREFEADDIYPAELIEEMKKLQPNADYSKLTMVGHSNGGDIAMYFAKQYPDEIKKVVTLDNLRVPFLTEGKFKILSFRSKDTQFKPDPGVVPDAEECEKSGITVVNTNFQHNDMRDTGPDAAKNSIQSMLDRFLDKTDSDVAPVDANNAPAKILDPGPVSL